MAEPEVLDLRGLRCPLPVIRTETALRKRASGDRFEVLADDPIAGIDIPHALRAGGHGFRRLETTGGAFRFEIVKDGG